MAAGTWKIYTGAKRALGVGGAAMAAGGVTLGVGVFKMSLHRASASAQILLSADPSTWASIGSEITPQGGYAAGGRALVPASGLFTAGRSVRELKFTYTALGLVFTASGLTLDGVKYAVIRTSVSAGGGKPLCFCTLSATAFDILSPNTLTIFPNTLGLFSLV